MLLVVEIGYIYPPNSRHCYVANEKNVTGFGAKMEVKWQMQIIPIID